MAEDRKTARDAHKDEEWVERVQAAVGAEFYRIANTEAKDAPSQKVRMWATRHATGGGLLKLAEEIAQTVALAPAIRTKREQGKKPTDDEVQEAVQGVIGLLGSPGRK